jgi:hypothetical protein
MRLILHLKQTTFLLVLVSKSNIFIYSEYSNIRAQARVSNRVHLLMVSRVRHSKAQLKEGSRQRLPAADFLASTGKH